MPNPKRKRPVKPQNDAPRMSAKLSAVLLMISDPNLPGEHRAAVLRDLASTPGPETDEVMKHVVECLAKSNAESVFEEKNRRLDAMLQEMQEGPMRSAVFVEMLSSNGDLAPQALVLLDDGTEAYVVVPHAEGASPLRHGDRVVLDGKGRVLLRRGAGQLCIGDVAQFERHLDDRHVEVSLRGGAERCVFLATHNLMAQIQAGAVGPGAALTVSTRRSLAIAALPPQDGLSHYRFLDRGPVPNVIVGRDIGAPPRCIEEVAEHVWMEMTEPVRRRRYRARRCCLKLLCGVSGAGKSLAVAAIHRKLYDLMSEITGVPIEQLPRRVFRPTQGQLLSMWLGESEKNWERVLNEAEQLADETFTTPDGRQFKLPVLIVLEELDGLGRARSSSQEPIYDRILTTVLQRLDPNRVDLSDRLIIVLATTNEPHLVDPALLRRVGGSIEVFGRLKRRSFLAVLEKLTRDLPVAANNGCTPQELWGRHIQTLAAWLFSPNGPDTGLVELTYAGSTTPVVKYRRDFLTGALVDRAVQQAADEACKSEIRGAAEPGITIEQLACALEAQLRSVVDQLRETNVGSYTDLPDGVRVATLRRLPQPSHLSFEFHRR